MQEKGAFIRTSNLYQNSDPRNIHKFEFKEPIKGPGPAFQTSYDNRYNENTAFASDKGRFHEPLNINNKPQFLIKGEKAEQFDDLKETNIKF